MVRLAENCGTGTDPAHCTMEHTSAKARLLRQVTKIKYDYHVCYSMPFIASSKSCLLLWVSFGVGSHALTSTLNLHTMVLFRKSRHSTQSTNPSLFPPPPLIPPLPKHNSRNLHPRLLTHHRRSKQHPRPPIPGLQPHNKRPLNAIKDPHLIMLARNSRRRDSKARRIRG